MKINAYKITSFPDKTFSYSIDAVRSFDDLKELNYKGEKIATFTSGKVLSLNNINDVGTPAELQYGGLKNHVKYDLLKSSLSAYLTSKGLVQVSRDKFIYPMNSSLPAKSFDSYHINFGFKVAINHILGNDHLFVDPKTVITKDGASFDYDFHKDNSAILSNNPITYVEFLKVLQITFGLLGEDFSISTDCGEYSFSVAPEINRSDLQSTGPEPKISFGANKSHDFPAAGLKKFGPWDYNESEERPREIKFGIIGPGFSLPLLRQVYAGEKTGNSYAFPGFQKVYHSTLKHNGDKARVELTENELLSCEDKDQLSKLFKEKARQIFADSNVAIIELPESALSVSYTNIRDFLKVVFWEEKLPTQLVLEHTTRNNQGLVIDNLALGLYVAAGGRPWILENPLTNHLFIGISFGLSNDKKRLIGIFEVFDGYGLSIDMEVTELIESPTPLFEKDLHVSKERLVEIVKNAILKYSDKYDGNHPEKLIIHKTTYFNDEELEVIDSLDEFQVDVSLVYISTYNSGMHLIPSTGTAIPQRRNYIKLAENKALIYTKGADDRGSSFDPFIPVPITIEVQTDNTIYGIDQACIDVLKLTKLNWNSVVSYERDPVTISHSRKIIKLLRQGLDLDNIPTSIVYFL